MSVTVTRTPPVTRSISVTVTRTSDDEINVRVRPVRVFRQVGLEHGAVGGLLLRHDVTVLEEELLHQLDDLVPT